VLLNANNEKTNVGKISDGVTSNGSRSQVSPQQTFHKSLSLANLPSMLSNKPGPRIRFSIDAGPLDTMRYAQINAMKRKKCHSGRNAKIATQNKKEIPL